MTAHRCHVRPCRKPCPPRLLTCAQCWKDVPLDLQKAVYATVGLRKSGKIDASWAPWWRAQARAIDAVLRAGVPFRWLISSIDAVDRILEKELLFADYLEGTITAEEHEQRKAALGTGAQ